MRGGGLTDGNGSGFGAGAPAAGAGHAVTESHELQVAVDRDVVLAAVGEAAESWGAEWRADGGGAAEPDRQRGGDLALPFVAGLRRGVLWGRLQLYPAPVSGDEPSGEQPGGAATRLVLAVTERRDHLQVAAVVVLLLSAFGALLTVIWPFFPELLPVAPFGAILALGGWFLVVSRLHSSGPEDFLELVRRVAEGEPEDKGKGGDGAE